MFQTKVVEKMKTYILCSKNLFANRAVSEIMWKKYYRAGQGTGEYTALAFCVLDT
jgi:hypothetical protein